ncbi:MAG: hypothetical protein IPJ28_13305 [Betaproteobacteria bacterium]|nr:hypothetical protein [Betaproteobacteria bacterium]
MAIAPPAPARRALARVDRRAEHPEVARAGEIRHVALDLRERALERIEFASARHARRAQARPQRGPLHLDVSPDGEPAGDADERRRRVHDERPELDRAGRDRAHPADDRRLRRHGASHLEAGGVDVAGEQVVEPVDGHDGPGTQARDAGGAQQGRAREDLDALAEHRDLAGGGVRGLDRPDDERGGAHAFGLPGAKGRVDLAAHFGHHAEPQFAHRAVGHAVDRDARAGFVVADAVHHDAAQALDDADRHRGGFGRARAARPHQLGIAGAATGQGREREQRRDEGAVRGFKPLHERSSSGGTARGSA